MQAGHKSEKGPDIGEGNGGVKPAICRSGEGGGQEEGGGGCMVDRERVKRLSGDKK